uniref:FLZ-type domain-containing protein n=1 Tax=Ananas comosus var. bracteatus TaxID=296719 RepID=A0A6V7PN78_ANACO|nr:unnamed protein product [Ananas comosus var. bracteatus]
MVVRESQPSIRKAPEPMLAIERPWIAEGLPSPTSPLERDARSPRGWRNRDSDGVGLAIVAALDRLCGAGASSSAAAAAAPIAIGASAAPRSRRNRGRFEVAESGGCGGACSASACGFKERSDGDGNGDGGAEFSLLDFLSCCYLCRKRLHGKDIYIYKEKAFCSMECRYRHIASEECQESFVGSDRVRRKSAAQEIASTPPQRCSGGPLFFTGVVVA